MVRAGRLLSLLVVLLSALPASAQQEYYQWRFGQNAGVKFGLGGAAAQVGTQTFPDGSACISNAAGQLLFATNGLQAWDASGQLLPGRITAPQTGFQLSRRQVLAVRQPGSSSRYYVFRNCGQQRFPLNNQSRLHLPYAVVDMSQRGGLGGIVSNDSLTLPNYSLALFSALTLNTNLVPIRHANGFDWWIVGQTMEGQFVSYLLSSTGINPIPVVSQPGRVLSYNNGVLRASADGRTVVLSTMEGDTQRAYTSVECGQFDQATGTVSGLYFVKRWPGVVTQTSSNQWMTTYTLLAGLELSPDGAALYVDTLNANYVVRFNLRAGSPTAVTASRVNIRPSGTGIFAQAGDMQLGPDGNIYVNQPNSGYLGRIEQPGAGAPAARYVPSAVNLGPGRQCLSSLPFALYDPNPVLTGIGGGLASCVGQAMPFNALGLGLAAGSAVAWNFGDPASGASNTASTPTATHTFSAAGTFTVTLTVIDATGRTVTAAQQVVVSSPLVVSLGPAVRLLCAGQTVLLTPGPQPAGTTYAWQDGSTLPTLTARLPGVYTVLVTNAQGCTSQASTRVEVLPTPRAFLGPDTIICLQQPYLLRPRRPQPAGTTFRWQDGSTGDSFLVQSPGSYFLEATAPNGCTDRAVVFISNGNCPVELPNIITPNGDQQNEYFVLKGLNAPEWRIEIYNRWGRKVYQNAQYDNRWNAPAAPNGVYYYRLFNSATGQQYKGFVEVLR
ncbi:MAG: hypothetical protein JWR44_2818 [Hymenobacter sp.]|nr:hypothetical protein [Hymenobacter sp.]